MKTLTTYYALQDRVTGAGVSGQTIAVYPTGTAVHGITVADLTGGNYKFTIDPTSDNLVLSRFYDVYVNSILFQQKIDLGQWEVYVTDLAVDAEQTFNFADLTDENGEALPTTIENAQIILIPKNNRQGKVAWTTTTVTITLDSSGEEGNGKFDLFIRIMK